MILYGYEYGKWKFKKVKWQWVTVTMTVSDNSNSDRWWKESQGGKKGRKKSPNLDIFPVKASLSDQRKFG